jgi:hypothetical protein
MSVAFMSLHNLLSNEMLPYFILCVEVFHSLNLNLNQKNLNLYKGEFKVNPANLFNSVHCTVDIFHAFFSRKIIR